ncbi:unnamed protein product [Blepharisma stoltei]|uniref:Purple acid phosphatase n=1 Tax=Blepharisma stoltei TaxID=1481888 RepID=A0AAU9IUV9_9CILI|nr:unnamed protein product [Blepharisma stoltei]
MQLLVLIIGFGIAIAGYVHPEQIHLSWTEEINQMRATWVTYLNAPPHAAYRPILCGNVPSPSNFTYIGGDTKKFQEGPHFWQNQYIHTTVFENLLPECWYEYKVSNLGSWSKTYLFNGRTPDTSQTFRDVNNSFTLIVFGDWGTGPIGQYTKHLLGEETLTRDYLGILHMGDIAYDLDDEDGKVGDDYLNMIQPIAATYPYMTVPGNHEKADNFTQYINRFNMPNNGVNQGTSFFYSFNLGPAHFIMYNTNPYFKNTSQASADLQTQWLANDLAIANSQRSIRPWIIVLAHHPLYCSQDWFEEGSQTDCGEQPAVIKPILEDLWYNNSVDLALQAHLHNYERDAAIYKNQTIPSQYDGQNIHINPNAPIYIVSGNAGNNHGHNDPASTTPQPWARYLSNDYGYGRLTVYNQTHLFWEQFSAVALTEIDYVWIIKDQPRYKPVLS